VVIFIICDLYDLVPEEIFRRGVQVGLNLLLIALYSFGLFAAYRYSVLGIRVVCIISCFYLHNLHKNIRHNLSLMITFLYFLETAEKFC
jgi:hypothetical protein